MKEISTVGHSNLQLPDFLSMILRYGINVIADVRSVPFSAANPQFARDSLATQLAGIAIDYVFLGNELGGRSARADCYVNGRVEYDRLARTETFKWGLGRLTVDIKKGRRIALMCSEKEPLDCHRAILIARHLELRGFAVKHILDTNRVEDHTASMQRLTRSLRINEAYAERSPSEMFNLAYEIQANNIAFRRKTCPDSPHRPLPLL